ncbi:MAG: ABC transporter permease [Candidatus Eisenbacteria bacterium]|nr:ABC transporter permease [Candidatus Eisenbacteria bacterium]
MKTYILKRFLHMIPLLFGISLLSFIVINLAPGDFLTTMQMNPAISAERIETLRREFGLDKPVIVQYLIWLKNIVLHLDFGYSFSRRVPVFAVLKTGMLNTLLLAGTAALITWGLAIPLGIVSAVRQYTWVDKLSSFVAFIGLSIPEVFFALLMIYFAATTGWFPIGGMRSLDFEYLSPFSKGVDLIRHLFLPALVLGTVPMASRMRQMRGNLLDVLRADYVTTARAKGLSERVVVYKHAVRNAINPLITIFGYTLASLLSGAFLVEVVMSWPGLGRITIEALFTRDLYLVMGALMMASSLLILGNLIADLLLAIADPRISYD